MALINSGVLWVRNDALPNTSTVLNTFRAIGKQVVYVTNNSTHTKETFFNKCKQLNFETTYEDAIYAANLPARYLKSINFQKKVYLIGSKGKIINPMVGLFLEFFVIH